MASYVLSFVVQTDEADFSQIVDDTVAALTADGHTPTEVRVQSDAGEQVVAVEAPPEEPPTEPPTEPPGRPTNGEDEEATPVKSSSKSTK